MKNNVLASFRIWLARLISPVRPGVVLTSRACFIPERRGYSCWCGKVHVGEYAEEGWIQHHCHHAGELTLLGSPDTDGALDLMCVDCGKVFFSIPMPLLVGRTEAELVGDRTEAKT